MPHLPLIESRSGDASFKKSLHSLSNSDIVFISTRVYHVIGNVFNGDNIF